jgi:hypothetical protein
VPSSSRAPIEVQPPAPKAREADVSIVARTREAGGEVVQAARSLKTRLMGMARQGEPGRPAREAYRGPVEEARVDIVRPEDKDAAIGKPADKKVISRFLQALKGTDEAQ